jgi:hypothetical protein
MLKLSQSERSELAAIAKKMRPAGPLPAAAHELAMSLWLRVTGIQLPAALTLASPQRRMVAMVARKVEMRQNRGAGWSLVVYGLNIRKTGATGNLDEWFSVDARNAFTAAKRTLLGEWVAVRAPAKAAVC